MSKDYTNNFLAFFQDLFRVEGKYGPKPLTPPFLVDFLGHAFKDGQPTARNILDARSKKQGKSALAGAVALFMASKEPYSEVVIAAADKDQAKDRVLRAVKFACQNGPLAKHTKVYKDVIELDIKSTITAIPMDWQSSAGGNYSAVIFDELHAWIYENNRRLFDELVPPPTQPNAVRWIASYAGFLGESELLKEWWDRGLTGERISDTLPLYMNHNANLLALIDTGPESWRMPWMTDKYIQEIQESERANTFRRLWLNEWTASESAFVPREAWEACYSKDVHPLTKGDKRRIVLGVDASTTRDLTGLIGTHYNEPTDKAQVIYVRAFRPKKGFLRMGKPTIDLEAVRDEILRLSETKLLDAVYYDPYQLASIAIELQRKGIRMIEFPQTNMRTEADQQLYDAIVGGVIQHYNHPDLNEHIRNAIAKESVRGFRLAKDKTSMKIDLAVALSMSLYGALEYQKRRGGGIHYMPNIIYDPPAEGYKYHEAGGEWFEIPIEQKAHKPGITWRNCPRCNRVCEACIAEMEAEGIYERDQQEARLIREAHPEYESPMNPEESRTIELYTNPRPKYTPAQLQQQQILRARKAFKESVKQRLKR